MKLIHVNGVMALIQQYYSWVAKVMVLQHILIMILQ